MKTKLVLVSILAFNICFASAQKNDELIRHSKFSGGSGTSGIAASEGGSGTSGIALFEGGSGTSGSDSATTLKDWEENLGEYIKLVRYNIALSPEQALSYERIYFENKMAGITDEKLQADSWLYRSADLAVRIDDGISSLNQDLTIAVYFETLDQVNQRLLVGKDFSSANAWLNFITNTFTMKNGDKFIWKSESKIRTDVRIAVINEIMEHVEWNLKPNAAFKAELDAVGSLDSADKLQAAVATIVKRKFKKESKP